MKLEIVGYRDYEDPVGAIVQHHLVPLLLPEAYKIIKREPSVTPAISSISNILLYILPFT